MVDFDVRVKLDAGSAQQQMRQVERGLMDIEGAAAKANKGFDLLGSAVTGFTTALSGAAINAAQQAISGLFNSIKSGINQASEIERTLGGIQGLIDNTGGSAGKTAAELDRFAIALGEATLTSRQEVLEASRALLSFTSITGENFERTIKLAQDVAETMGGDLVGSTVQLAKALEEPTTGLGALSRSGIQFTEQQKDLIKALDESGDKAAAQAEIFKAVEAQYKGAGEAAAQGLAGALDTLGERQNQILTQIGEQLNPALTDLVNAFSNAAQEALNNGTAQEVATEAARNLTKAVEGISGAIAEIDFEKLAEDINSTIRGVYNLAEAFIAVVGAIRNVNDWAMQGIPGLSQLVDLLGFVWNRGPSDSLTNRRDRLYGGTESSRNAAAYGQNAPGFMDPTLFPNQSYYSNPEPTPVPKNAGSPPTSNPNATLPPPPSTTGTSATSAMNSAAQQATSKAQAIASAARQLGVSPLELAALFSFESAGTFNPGIKGGDGGNYWGLWQAGGPERQFAIKALGLPPGTDYSKLSFEQQVAAFVPWAASRGYKPGMGQRALYSTILTGGPGEDRWGLQDSNGTSVLGAPIGPGSSHWLNAEKFLASQNFNNASLQYTESFADLLFNQKPFLTNPMAVGLGDPLNLAGLMKEAQKQVAMENFDEANRGLLEQIELIERKLELAGMDATQREHILEIEALERESRAQLAEREEQLNELVKEGALNDDEKAQQLAELITILERYKLAVLDTQEAEQKAIELQEQAQKRMERIAEQQARAREYVDQLTNGFTNLAVSVISGASSMEQALSQFFNTILSYLANQAFQSLFGSLFNGLFGLGGFGGGGLSAAGAFNAAASPSGIGGFIGSANGNVLQGGFQAFANGGVVTRPTLGLIGEGSMNEAVVPLPDGRRIPVQMQGGGGTNITVNVNNPSSGEDGRRLGRQISEAIKAELVQQSRVGGLLRR